MKRLLIVLFSVLLYCLSGNAEEGFFKPAALKPAQKLMMSKVIPGAPKLVELANTCGGAFISDKGHFITALHCVQSCLKTANLSTISKAHYPSYQTVQVDK